MKKKVFRDRYYVVSVEEVKTEETEKQVIEEIIKEEIRKDVKKTTKKKKSDK